MTKNELRKLLKTELSAVSAEKKLSASKKACGLLFEFVLKNNFDIVLSYIDLKNEISPQEINCALMMKNKIVAVPKVVPKTQRMNFYILDNSIKILKQLEHLELASRLKKSKTCSMLITLYKRKYALLFRVWHLEARGRGLDMEWDFTIFIFLV